VIGEAGIVKDHHLYGVAVAPEMFVIFLDRRRDITQAVGWDDEYCGTRVHFKSFA
jgi:hypothetical protein